MAGLKTRRRIAQTIRRYPMLLGFPFRLWRFFQARYTLGVVGVIFNDQNKVLLVEHVFHRLPWGLPGGWVDRNENPSDAVRRELREELQLQIEPIALVATQLTFSNHLDFAYLCKAQNDVGSLSDELLDFQWYDPHKLPHLYDFHHHAIASAHQYLSQE
jgi:ADP-ribose pyrophosphatase YjhB (NUDIX family)